MATTRNRDRLIISSVSILNYRSIVDEKFLTGPLNFFVGLNDVGKSNILRALDLFFNYATPSSPSPFIFGRDLSRQPKLGQGRAKEISIELCIHLPAPYTPESIYWTKKWRLNGIHSDQIQDTKRRPVSSKSKIKALLSAIRYEYVPAIKGEDYFARLLANLHDVLVSTVEKDIRSASGEFTRTINTQTSNALAEIENRLGIKSKIELPSDLRDLFSRLEFHSDDQVPLAMRGDGIKSRHVSILLHYIAKQAQTLRKQGTPKPYTIWGFEEPENNLEMSMASELAKSFSDYCKDIQIFATTHSPAFYCHAENMQHKVFLTTRERHDNRESTRICPVQPNGLIDIDKHVGFLPSIVPSFRHMQEERDRLLEKVQSVEALNMPTLFVEGHTDQSLILKLLQINNSPLAVTLSIKTDNCAGINWVLDMLRAWAYSRKKIVAVGLLDSDRDGKHAKELLTKELSESKKKHTKALVLPKSLEIDSIHKKRIDLPYSIEELFPASAWKHADCQGWLVNRNDVVKNNIEFEGNSFDGIHTSFEDYCKEQGLTPDDLLKVTKVLKPFHKKAFSKYICSLEGEEAVEMFMPLLPLLKKLETLFKQQA